MALTLAFDVYGTLINTHGVVEGLREHVGDDAMAFSWAWREKQLEYSFRRALMRDYVPFPVCVAQSLDYVCTRYEIELDEAQRMSLLDRYAGAPAFEDARAGLEAARAAGWRLFAFSNGTAQAVEHLLGNAGIAEFFIDIVSCDEVRSFKPNPEVYAHFLTRADSAETQTWMISSNPFDVLGAMHSGMRAAWVNRPGGASWDPWDVEPSVTVGDLSKLASVLPA